LIPAAVNYCEELKGGRSRPEQNDGHLPPQTGEVTIFVANQSHESGTAGLAGNGILIAGAAAAADRADQFATVHQRKSAG
jgi:hypothetical protein